MSPFSAPRDTTTISLPSSSALNSVPQGATESPITPSCAPQEPPARTTSTPGSSPCSVLQAPSKTLSHLLTHLQWDASPVRPATSAGQEKRHLKALAHTPALLASIATKSTRRTQPSGCGPARPAFTLQESPIPRPVVKLARRAQRAITVKDRTEHKNPASLATTALPRLRAPLSTLALQALTSRFTVKRLRQPAQLARAATTVPQAPQARFPACLATSVLTRA